MKLTLTTDDGTVLEQWSVHSGQNNAPNNVSLDLEKRIARAFLCDNLDDEIRLAQNAQLR